MKKIFYENKRLVLMIVLVILTGIFVFAGNSLRGWLTGKADQQTSTTLTTIIGSEHSSSDASNVSETPIAKHTPDPLPPQEFSSNIQVAYDNETVILKGRELAIGFYNVKPDVIPDPSFFRKYFKTESMATALYDQYKALVDNQVQRQESLTTYTITSESPFTVNYTIIGNKNNKKEQVVYQVTFDDSKDAIVSFVQLQE